MGLAVALPAMAAANSVATQTKLSAETHDTNGRTQATFSVAVTSEDGLPASGAVVIQDSGKPLAGAALNAGGTAKVVVSLAAGDHNFRAVYEGDNAHKASFSATAAVSAQQTATPDFQIAVNPGSLSLTAGQSGVITVTVTPVNASSLAAPMFVTLSCSGFPDQSSCSFTPENVEIAPNATAAVTSSMVVTTQAQGTTSAVAQHNTVAWAVLLPGILGLGGLAFSTRRRRWLHRISLLALVGFVSVLGTTACAPRYNYYHHGPTPNLPTPAGIYTLQVTAQSSNGIAATTHSTTFALTVK